MKEKGIGPGERAMRNIVASPSCTGINVATGGNLPGTRKITSNRKKENVC